MPGSVFLRAGSGVTLRTVEREDLEFFTHNWNDPRVRRLLRGPEPQNGHQAAEAFEEWLSGDGSASLMICDEAGAAPEPVGNVALFRIDEQAGHGYIACWVDPAAQGEGYATVATQAMFEYAFAERGLHKLIAEAFAPNRASQRVLEKVGFREEGVVRDEKFVDGEYVDVRGYGLLEPGWSSDDATKV